MDVLFPSEPFDSKTVDSSFEAELQAAKAAGLRTQLIDVEALDAGDSRKAVRRLAREGSSRSAIYRGWMLDVPAYEALHGSLFECGYALINDPAQYRHAHHLPASYPLIAGRTPKTVWTSAGSQFDLPTVMELLEPMGEGPVIVKDYVKSQKHYWEQACFIPSARDPDAVRRVVTRFIELQGDSLTGGLVFRKFEELDALTSHSKSGMPLTKEFRIFFLDRTPLAVAEYWEEGDYGSERPPIDPFLPLAAKIDSRFFTMDVARRKDGTWIVMELGDGQVSGIPDRLPASAFYAALAARFDVAARDAK